MKAAFRFCKSCRRRLCKDENDLCAMCEGRGLNKRDRAIAALVRQGMQNKEIAQSLNLTFGTVAVYLSHIFRRTGIPNRTALAVSVTDAGELLEKKEEVKP